MPTPSPALRVRCLGAALALLAGTAIAHAADPPSPRHHFSMRGNLEPTQRSLDASAPVPMNVKGVLSRPAHDADVQSGGAFVVMAKLAESPLGCSGSDLIFADGFDG